MAVRRESVEISVTDQLGSALIKDAAAAKLLQRELDNLSGHSIKTSRAQKDLQRDLDNVSRSTERGGASIDQYSGRLGLLAEAAVGIGPALLPISAVAIPAITAMTAGLGAAAGAFGVTLLAVHGLGDGLKALDAYQLEPTAANLQKMQDEMKKLGPAGAEFVHFLDGLEPQLASVQQVARAGMFPGFEAGITDLLTRLPQVKNIVGDLATTIGSITEDASKNLASSKFDPFFNYVHQTAGPTLRDFAASAGNVGEALANMLIAFDPLSQSFTGGLLRMSQAFAQWSRSLNTNEGFQSFLAYVQESGPQVIALIGSLVSALAGIAQAAAPIGSVVLPALTAFIKAIGVVASSDFGTPIYGAVAAYLALGRALKLTTIAMSEANGASFLAGANPYVVGAAALAAVIATLSLSTSDMTKSIENANTALANDAGAKTLKSRLQDVDNQIATHTRLQSNSWHDLGYQLSHVPSALKSDWDDFFHHTDQKAEETRVRLHNALFMQRYQPAPKGSSIIPLLTGPLGANARAFKQAALSADDFTKSLNRVNDVLTHRAAYRDYQAAIDDATHALKANGKTLDANNAKGRDNGDKLDALAQRTLEYAQTLKGVDRTDFLSNARKQLVETAHAFGLPIPKAQALADRLHILAKSDAKPKVSVDTNEADKSVLHVNGALKKLNLSKANPMVQMITGDFDAGVNHVKSSLASIHDKTVYVRMVQTGTNHAGVQGSFDTGGFTGRGGHLEPAGVVHRNEVVIPEPLVRRDWGMLKSRYGHLPGFDRGGLVGSSRGHDKPLFDGEGPRYYKAAYRHGKPFAIDGPSHWDWPYQTGLANKKQAEAFTNWVSENGVPFNPDAKIVDYDMRGYWLKTKGKGWHEGSHFPDTYKTPYDTTFSHESKYATKDNPFWWRGDRLVDTRNGQLIFAANGGYIQGPGGPRDDSVSAQLSNGEFVVNAEATRANRAILEVLNAGGMIGQTHSRTNLNPGANSWGLKSDPWGLGKAATDAAHGLKGLRERLADSNKALDAQKAELQKATQFHSAVATSLSGDLFGNGLAGFNLAATANRNDNTDALKALRIAKQHGLSGPLFAALAGSGDFAAIEQFSHLSRGAIAREERLYGQSIRSGQRLGDFATTAHFGESIDDLRDEIRQQIKTNKALEAQIKRMGKHVRDGAQKGAHEGTRKGQTDRSKNTGQRVRVNR